MARKTVFHAINQNESAPENQKALDPNICVRRVQQIMAKTQENRQNEGKPQGNAVPVGG